MKFSDVSTFSSQKVKFDQNSDTNNTETFADISIIPMFLFVQLVLTLRKLSLSLFLIPSSDFNHNKKIEKLARICLPSKKNPDISNFQITLRPQKQLQ